MRELTSASAIVNRYNDGWLGCELVRFVKVEASAGGVAAKVGGDLGKGSSGYSGDGGNATKYRREEHG